MLKRNQPTYTPLNPFSQKKSKVTCDELPINSNFTQGEEYINQLVSSLSQEELVAELEHRGITIGGDQQRGVLIYLLKQLLRLESLCDQQQTSLTWKLVTKEFNTQYFSEIIMFVYNGQIWMIGPYFLTPKSPPITLTTTCDLNGMNLQTKNLTGAIPNPFMVFKRMPIYFVAGTFLYLAYSNFETNTYCIDKLNLETLEWCQVKTIGELPPARDYVDGCFHDGHFIISGHSTNVNSSESLLANNVIHKLNLETNVWSIVSCIGSPNSYPNGSSIKYKNNLVTFNKAGDCLYFLDLTSFEWKKQTIQNKLPDFNCRRHSHLSQIWEDDLILLRAVDQFQFNCLNLANGGWRIVDTVGKRPSKVRTEASITIDNNILYTFGGQTSKNHLLSLSLTNETSNGDNLQFENQKWIQSMFKDGFEDVTFILDDGVEIKAHKTVLSSKNEYFKSMLTGSFAESKSDQIRVHQVTSSSFEALISFYYNSFSFQTTQADPQDLLKVAEQYLAFDFQKVIGEELLGSLTSENALDILRILLEDGSLFCQNLKEFVLKFIRVNHQEVSQHQSFITHCQECPQMIQMIFALGPERESKQKNGFQKFQKLKN